MKAGSHGKTLRRRIRAAELQALKHAAFFNPLKSAGSVQAWFSRKQHVMSKTDVARLLDTLSRTEGSEQAPRVLLIRANRSQKGFIARALQALEALNDAMPLNSSQMRSVFESLAPIEREATECGLAELAECARTASILATSFFYAEGELAPSQVDAVQRLVRLMSMLLLRVYITGTDAGGHLEREQAQRIVRSLVLVNSRSTLAHCTVH